MTSHIWPGAGRQRLFVSLVCLLVAGTMIGLSANLAKLAAEAGLTPFALLAWSVLGASLVHLGAAISRSPCSMRRSAPSTIEQDSPSLIDAPG
ncbi:hypothetical protein [Luteimonas salinilitoris]|uniref:EamA domain-containing protein n=1 Tax=Luteimonas salinilitoris TaxID=3237697 RepID=A0ABV4HTI7_9GAMM